MIAGGFIYINVKTNIEFGIFTYFYIISISLKWANICKNSFIINLDLLNCNHFMIRNYAHYNYK